MTRPIPFDTPLQGSAPTEPLLDLPSPRRPVAIGVLLLWLGSWVLGLAFLLQQLPAGGRFGFEGAFVLVWTLLWAVAGCGAIVYLAWLIAGRERVSLEGDSLVIRRGVAVVWRTRRWRLDSIHRLRTFGREISPVIALGLEVAGQGASGVRFESAGRVVRFARSLSEPDARAVVRLLEARCGFAREAGGLESGPPPSPPRASAGGAR